MAAVSAIMYHVCFVVVVFSPFFFFRSCFSVMYCISNCENRDTGFLRSERSTTFKRKGVLSSEADLNLKDLGFGRSP